MSSKRLKQAASESSQVYIVDYGRLSDVDDGRRIFNDQQDWFDTLLRLKQGGHKLHRIAPNVMSCSIKNGPKNENTRGTAPTHLSS